MCGICGKVAASPLDPEQIRAMTRALAHRGPDGEAFYSDDGVAFGHRRLSVIDLETGAQPMSTPDGAVTIVYNGEIYNYQELRRELSAQGYALRTKSDSETILQCYMRDGTACLASLRGMFAFAIWDRRTKRLFAARDRMGQKPFYYAERPGEFVFGSEIKALLKGEPGLAQLDVEALDEYLTLRTIAAPRSMFRSIRKLPPAHFLTYSVAEGLRVERYWDIAYEPKLDARTNDLIDELEHRLVETIRAHLVSDVPVGAFMSGGLDSTLIVALLAKHRLMDGLRTFTVSLPLAQFDEAPAARLVAAHSGTIHREETVRPTLVNDLPRLVRQLDEPSDALASCMDLVAGIARQDVTVVLGGDGGDELFAGYDRYLGHGLVNRYAAVPKWIRERVAGPVLSRVADGNWYKSAGHRLKWMHEMARYSGADRYVASLAYFYFREPLRSLVYGPALHAAVGGSRPGDVTRRAFERAAASDVVDRMLYADLQSRLPDHPVMIQDRMTMAHGLEARSPFMDHKLAEFVARLPVRLKAANGRVRRAEVLLAERVLPREVVRRPKQGFASALPYLLRDEFDVLYRAFLPASHLASAGLLNQAGITALLNEHRTSAADHAARLWLLVNAEVWFRMFIEGEGDDALRETINAAGHSLTPGAR